MIRSIPLTKCPDESLCSFMTGIANNKALCFSIHNLNLSIKHTILQILVPKREYNNTKQDLLVSDPMLNLSLAITINGFPLLNGIPLRYINMLYDNFNIPLPIKRATYGGHQCINIPWSCLPSDMFSNIVTIHNIKVSNLTNPKEGLQVNGVQLYIDSTHKPPQILHGKIQAYIVSRKHIYVPELFKYMLFDPLSGKLQNIEYDNIKDGDVILAQSLYDIQPGHYINTSFPITIPGEYCSLNHLEKITILPSLSCSFNCINLLEWSVDCTNNLNFDIYSCKGIPEQKLTVTLNHPIISTVNLIYPLIKNLHQETSDISLESSQQTELSNSIPLSKLFTHMPPSYFILKNNSPTSMVLYFTPQQARYFTSSREVMKYTTVYSVRQELKPTRIDYYDGTTTNRYLSFYKKTDGMYLICNPKKLREAYPGNHPIKTIFYNEHGTRLSDNDAFTGETPNHQLMKDVKTIVLDSEIPIPDDNDLIGEK